MPTFDLNSDMKKEFVRSCQSKCPVENYQTNVDGLARALASAQESLDAAKTMRDESLNVLMAYFQAGPGASIEIVKDDEGNPIQLTW